MHAKIIHLLIEAGSNVNATVSDQWTPLHITARYMVINIVV